ncbi:acyl--CoA ligase [Candidatus Binatia bacterium]|nr:acyl--CoA ligase [Candidatus Binatia bacterium]
MIVADWLHARARRRPSWPALVTPDGAMIPYGALDERVAALALRLRARGIERGDRVLALLPAGTALVELLHACPRVGMVLAPFDPRAGLAEVERAIATVRPRLIVAAPVAAEVARHAARSVAALALPDVAVCVVEPDGAPLADDVPRPAGALGGVPPRIDLAAPHSIVFTSGTTGRPRGVVLRAGNHLASARAAAARLGADASDRWLACLPLHHVGGLAVLLRAAIAGGTVILQRGFDPAAVARALHDDGVTQLSLVPTTLRRLLDVPGATPRALRVLLLGGARSEHALVAAARAAGWPVAPTYGLTETCSQVVTARPGDEVSADGFVGMPLDGVELRVLDANGSTARAGVPGVITLRGPMVAAGTLGDDGATAPLAPAGWLRTADRGVLDERGCLTVLGRADDVIVSGGENVTPEEVEAALLAHPAVADAGVAGVPDAEWGQVVCAWIVPRAGVEPTLAELRDGCGMRLARHKLPRRLVLVSSLPRTASGKLKRRLLVPSNVPAAATS